MVRSRLVMTRAGVLAAHRQEPSDPEGRTALVERAGEDQVELRHARAGDPVLLPVQGSRWSPRRSARVVIARGVATRRPAR